MRVIAVPVKSLDRAKSRLAPVLSRMERASLTLAMLEDVLDAAVPAPGWETWVISPDESVLEIAARRGARPMTEARPPLSAAIRQVEDEAAAADADALAVLLADLPLVTTGALGDALRTLGPVVAARAEDGDGTNLLLRRPPRSIPARFGRDSYRKHLQGAAIRGLPVSEVRGPELSFDLDLPADVARLVEIGAGGRTRSVCQELDVAARLRVRT
jgi:2-phospho-L-lactate/phosphoenolpyruvate guanylyltransferase